MRQTAWSRALQPGDGMITTFAEYSYSSPEAILTWFYPGSTIGHEFLHPKKKRRNCPMICTRLKEPRPNLRLTQAQPIIERGGAPRCSQNPFRAPCEEERGEHQALPRASGVGRDCGASSSIPFAPLDAVCENRDWDRDDIRPPTDGNRQFRRYSRRDSRCNRGHRHGSNDDARKPCRMRKTLTRPRKEAT